MEANLLAEGRSGDAQHGTELAAFEDEDEPPSRPPSAGEEVRSSRESLQNPKRIRCLFDTFKSTLGHSRDLIFAERINVLLVFVPTGIAVGFADVDPILDFILNALAIIPLAVVISTATESLASRLGDTLGALLNVTVGNAAELMIFFAALSKDQIQIVQASLLGSILANLLLVLGTAFIAGGLRYENRLLDRPAGRISIGLLDFGLLISLFPVAFLAWVHKRQDKKVTSGILGLSRMTSVVLILIYAYYLRMQMTAKPYFREIDSGIIESNADTSIAMTEFRRGSSRRRSSSGLSRVPPSNTDRSRWTRWTPTMKFPFTRGRLKEERRIEDAHQSLLQDTPAFDNLEEISEDSDLEQPTTILAADMSNDCRQHHEDGPHLSSDLAGTDLQIPANHSDTSLSTNALVSNHVSPSLPPSPPSTISTPPPSRFPPANVGSFSSSDVSLPDASHLGHLFEHSRRRTPESQKPLAVAIIILIISTGIVSVCTELAVDAIPSIVNSWNVSQIFLGLIVLPIVGNAAEHVTAFKLAMHNKMVLAKSVAVESSTQIVLFVTPAMVLLGWARGRDMSLQFDPFEIASVVTTTFVVSTMVFYGRSDKRQGFVLVTIYLIIAFGALFDPGYAPL